MKAKSTSWEHKPFTEGIPFPLNLEIDKNQIERISKGLIPEEMEDKWFIYYEEPYLYIHRSWTGQPVFKLKFTETQNGYQVTEALLSTDIANSVIKDKSEIEHISQLAFFVVSNILLGEKGSPNEPQ